MHPLIWFAMGAVSALLALLALGGLRLRAKSATARPARGGARRADVAAESHGGQELDRDGAADIDADPAADARPGDGDSDSDGDRDAAGYADGYGAGHGASHGVSHGVSHGRGARVAPVALPRATDGDSLLVPEPSLFDREQARREALDSLAVAVGSQLAKLTSAVEGHANLLCESIGEPRQVASRAEQLEIAVHRLRFFASKILCSARHRGAGRSLRVRPTDVRALLERLRQELQAGPANGLQVEIRAGVALPLAIAETEALRDALLYLVETLIEREPDASVLAVRANTQLEGDDETKVAIEIVAETEDSTPVVAHASDRLEFGLTAACNLLEALGAQVQIEHVPGVSASACVVLSACEAPPPAPNEPAELAGPPEPRLHALPHRFGGVLVLEDDPSLRDLLCDEVAATGRNLVACHDGTSARTLLRTTPERFEMLILDHAAPRGEVMGIVREALGLNPDLKLILLTDRSFIPDALPWLPQAQVRELVKPFGIAELREALAPLRPTTPIR